MGACWCGVQTIVLAEKPVISDDTNAIDPALLEVLLANVSTLAAVFHKPPEAFVSRTKVATTGDGAFLALATQWFCSRVREFVSPSRARVCMWVRVYAWAEDSEGEYASDSDDEEKRGEALPGSAAAAAGGGAAPAAAPAPASLIDGSSSHWLCTVGVLPASLPPSCVCL